MRPAPVLPLPAWRLPHLALIIVFTLTLFTSAALMFSVQPMAGRMLLPLVGGTPAGWIAAMAFFQLALLAGYTLAYGLSCLSPRRHAAGYLVVLAAGIVWLPVTLSAPHGGVGDARAVFALLAGGVGMPFIALSATATTVQRLFSTSSHPHARDPYFLYGASNLGSFAGLLLYPLLVEPALTLGQQGQLWQWAYLALIALATLCALATRQPLHQTPPRPAAVKAPPVTQKLCWIAYAFIPASLLMGYTGFITSELYSAPLLWVIPLSIYLLSFLVAFRGATQDEGTRLWPLHLLAVAASLALILTDRAIAGTSLLAIAVHVLALGIIAVAFHRALYAARPDTGDGRPLAVFYLMLATGGALAGIFNAFIAPVVFDGMYELPLVLLASLLFPLSYRPLARRSRPAVLVILMLATLVTVLARHDTGTVFQARNFYGTVTIYDRPYTYPETQEASHIRILAHDRVPQGMQVLSGAERLMPAAYYWSVNEVFTHYAPKNILVLGLGTGAMSCFGTPHSAFTYIDINPAIIAAAQEYFTYLQQCPAARPPRIITGDGRIETARLDERFDLIVIDVFSSAHIPAHMLTREAIDIYRGKLAPGGVILFHLSSRFFDLVPVLAAAAQDAGLEARTVERLTLDGQRRFDIPSRWLAVTQDAKPFDRFAEFTWETPETPPSARMWRDDFVDYPRALKSGAFLQK